MKQLGIGLIGFSFFVALSASATPVTVQEMGSGAGESGIYITSTSPITGEIGPNANVFAGIINLQVNGVSTEGFCIDPYHWSVSGPQSYSLVPLTSAPKAPGGPMNQATATGIAQLWAEFFSPTMGNAAAAGLQIAIWELVTGTGNSGNTGTFTLNTVTSEPNAVADASQDLNWLALNPSAHAADLQGLTGPGQDYVIDSVPDGGATIIMLGFALFGLGVARRKFQVC